MVRLFLAHGFTIWNNYWYAGRYSFVGYSLLYYPVAAFVGIKTLAVASAAVAAGAFSIVAQREWGPSATWARRLFALMVAGTLLSGAFPYAFGLAVALTALALLQRNHRLLFALLVVVALIASPLAFALLVVTLAGIAVSLGNKRIAIAGVAVAAGTAYVMQRLFPSGVRLPFPSPELACVLVFCALGFAFTYRVTRASALRFVFPAYGLACLVAFFLPSQVGENAARLRYVAFPLAVLVLSLRGWRPLLPASAAAALAFSWNATPLAFSVLRAAGDPSSQSAYWRPASSGSTLHPPSASRPSTPLAIGRRSTSRERASRSSGGGSARTTSRRTSCSTTMSIRPRTAGGCAPSACATSS